VKTLVIYLMADPDTPELARAAVEGGGGALLPAVPPVLPVQPFVDPDPFQQLTFPSRIAAKLAIADYLGLPLAKLPQEQRTAIDLSS